MRSSGRTTVSRTSARTDSVRRSRRDRFFRSACCVSILGFAFFGSVLIFIVILSPEKIPRATRRAESPAGALEGMIGAEIFSAHQASIEVRLLLGISTDETTAFAR